MKKEYQVSDLFYTSWAELGPRTHAHVFGAYLAIKEMKYDDAQYGYALIAILRLLRRRSLLVDRITVSQAVDIYNDLAFLSTPWYNFPNIDAELITPAPKLSRATFDQFIYADNEYSGFLATEDPAQRLCFLRRLAVTLYTDKFDKEEVDTREKLITRVNVDELLLVLYTYSHVRKFVMDRCKTLLPATRQAVDDLPTAPQQTGAQWHLLKHQAAKTLVFGDFDKLGATNMYSVLDHLEILAKEQEENHAKS